MAASPPDQDRRAAGKGSNALIIVLVVLVIAALAGDGYLLATRKDSSPAAAAEALPTSAAPVASTSAPAGTTVTHKSGTFSIVLPANGWQTKSDGESAVAKGAPAIQFAPDLAAYAKGDGVVTGFAMVYLTGNATTPKEYVAFAKKSNGPGCTWSAPKVFEYKDFKGTFVDRKPCTTRSSDGALAGFDSIQLGVTRSDGTKVGMVIRDAPGQTSVRTLALTALESIKSG